MKTHDLQNLLAALEQRFGAVTGDTAEHNTVATYTDGFLDCLRWIHGRSLRDSDAVGYIMRDVPGTERPPS